jgi:hypothetical protein
MEKLKSMFQVQSAKKLSEQSAGNRRYDAQASFG